MNLIVLFLDQIVLHLKEILEIYVVFSETFDLRVQPEVALRPQFFLEFAELFVFVAILYIDGVLSLVEFVESKFQGKLDLCGGISQIVDNHIEKQALALESRPQIFLVFLQVLDRDFVSLPHPVLVKATLPAGVLAPLKFWEVRLRKRGLDVLLFALLTDES